MEGLVSLGGGCLEEDVEPVKAGGRCSSASGIYL